MVLASPFSRRNQDAIKGSVPFLPKSGQARPSLLCRPGRRGKDTGEQISTVKTLVLNLRRKFLPECYNISLDPYTGSRECYNDCTDDNGAEGSENSARSAKVPKTMSNQPMSAHNTQTSELIHESPENSAEFIDEEDTGSTVTIKPWDPGKIRITTKTFSLREVVEQIRDGEIDLSPDFQRQYVWKILQRTRLIESVLLGIPLPAFYFDQASDGTYKVVDGVQRLSTISLFMRDEHRMSAADLEYLKNLDGLTYNELDPAALRRFRSTQIVVHVIEPQTPDEVKYDIFSRVNTLGSPLSAQEIRHAMSKPRARKFIARLAECPEFDAATQNQYWRRDKETGEKIRDSGRMTNRELALRFCAFRYFSEAVYRHFSSLDSYLIDYTKRLDGTSELHPPLTEQDMESLYNDFVLAMSNAHQVLGNAAFRRWPLTQARRGPINRALFEAQAIALADYPLDRLAAHKDKIETAFRSAFDDPNYLRAVTVGTGDPNSVKFRLEHTKSILEGEIM